MTLNASGPIGIGNGVAGQDIALEFSLPANTPFPAGFYGKGGAPASGPLSFSDFYGRSNTAVATAAPSSVSGSSSLAAFTIGSSTCSVSGGVGPFTYAWTKVSGSAKINITGSSTSASVTFDASTMAPAEFAAAGFQCAVTDTGNGSVVSLSNIVTVEAERF